MRMNGSRRIIWLWSLGCFLNAMAFGAPLGDRPPEERAAQIWAERFAKALKKPFLQARKPVMHLTRTGEEELVVAPLPLKHTAPLAGPMSLFVNVATTWDFTGNRQEFESWLNYRATPIQRQRYEQIMADLRRFYLARGYRAEQADQLALQLFELKLQLYSQLIVRGALNTANLPKDQNLNPYSQNPKGNSSADNYNLGLMCQKVGDHKQAAALFERAARTNHAMAQANLAYLYEKGLGVPIDLAKALDYYLKAAQQGHAIAQYNLGRIYQNGLTHGTERVTADPVKADVFLQRAASQGIVAAYHQLGVLYYTHGLRLTAANLTAAQKTKWDTNQDGVISLVENQHLQHAHDYFLFAAQQKHGPAQHALGVMYQRGHGIAANPKLAVNWLEKAATHQLPDSIYNLALAYENGDGVRKNLPRAFTLYRQAALLGHAPSQYNLGLFYYHGRKAGTRLTTEVNQAFKAQFPAEELPQALVKLNPIENAILSNTVAKYHELQDSQHARLELLVPEGQAVFLEAQLAKLAGGLSGTKTDSLGGDDPVQAYTWWKIAADNNQQAAITAKDVLHELLTPDQRKCAESKAEELKSRIAVPSAPSPVAETQSKVPFQAKDWSTGFFVSEDGYIVTGKHLANSGDRFQVITENGTFPARAINLPGDLGQYLLLKVDGDYRFPTLPLSASHSTRAKDAVQVLGYQLPHESLGTLPQAAQADTRIKSVLGAQADPRFFTLQSPVLGDRLMLKFERYMDDQQRPIESPLNPHSTDTLVRIQQETIQRIQGALRGAHVLLGNTYLSIGYQLETDLWYDRVTATWYQTEPEQDRAEKYPEGFWLVLDGRQIQTLPPLTRVKDERPLIRLAVIPGRTEFEGNIRRLHTLAASLLTEPVPGSRAKTSLETFIQDAEFEVISRRTGFRGTALLNNRGQAIGLFFPGANARTPDVFRNFSSYHQYLLKSDHLIAFLNRLPDVKYHTQPPQLRVGLASDEVGMNEDAYRLAKARSAMVLIQVADESSLAAAIPGKGGAKP